MNDLEDHYRSMFPDLDDQAIELAADRHRTENPGGSVNDW